MPKLDFKEELIRANDRCLQLQAQLDSTNKNYITLNNRYLKQLELISELKRQLVIVKMFLDKASALHKQVSTLLDQLEKEK